MIVPSYSMANSSELDNLLFDEKSFNKGFFQFMQSYSKPRIYPEKTIDLKASIAITECIKDLYGDRYPEKNSEEYKKLVVDVYKGENNYMISFNYPNEEDASISCFYDVVNGVKK
ncbi:hypothetical protein R50073_45790 [Maricurvus nonylphenolicus]